MRLLRKFFIFWGRLMCPHAPEVIIDIIFDKGLFYVAIKNIGKQPAYRVSTRFENKIIGVEGAKEISALSLFNNIEFMPPKKEITTFLDISSSFFQCNDSTIIVANITFYDSYGIKFSKLIRHDLEIYREIGFTNKDDSKSLA